MRRFKRILSVVDTEENSETAIIHSLKIANDHQASVTFVAVVEMLQSWHTALLNKDGYNRNLQETVENKKSEITGWISKIAPSVKVNVEVYAGVGFIQIIKTVTKNQHDLLIKCAEDTDWLDRMFGSEDMHLLRKCPCPVLMLMPGKNDNFRSILATIDVNNNSNEVDQTRVQDQLNKKVLEYSASFCLPELTELHVGSAWEAYAESFLRNSAFTRLPDKDVDTYVEQERKQSSDELARLMKEMDNMLGKEAIQYLLPKTHLVKGKASREIPLMAEQYDIDLIVMGTVGRIGIPGLIIGNTAESILEQAKCSVLAIKPEGFETPVV